MIVVFELLSVERGSPKPDVLSSNPTELPLQLRMKNPLIGKLLNEKEKERLISLNPFFVMSQLLDLTLSLKGMIPRDRSNSPTLSSLSLNEPLKHRRRILHRIGSG